MLYKPSQANKFYLVSYALASICLILVSCQGKNTQIPAQPAQILASSRPFVLKPDQDFKTQAVDTLPMPFDASLCGPGCQVTGTASFTLVDKSTGAVSYKTAGPNAILKISSTGQVQAQVSTPGGSLYAGPKAVSNSNLSFTQLGPETVSGDLDTSAVTCNFGSGSYYYWDSSSINTPVYYFQTGTFNLSYQDNKVIYHATGITSKDMGQWIAPWDASCRSGSSYENKLITEGTIDITVTLPIVKKIDIEASPAQITSSQGIISNSNVDVTPSKKTEPWIVEATAPETAPSCEQPNQSGLDDQYLIFPFDPSRLGNGIYNLKAKYVSDSNVSDNTAITVNLPVAVTPDKEIFNPRNQEQINFSVQAPPCPQWSLELNGQGETENGTPLTCSKTFTGTGDRDVLWDGSCDGGEAVGEWTVDLKSGSQVAHNKVTALAPEKFDFESAVSAEKAYTIDLLEGDQGKSLIDKLAINQGDVEEDILSEEEDQGFSVLANSNGNFSANGRPIKLIISSYVEPLSRGAQIVSGHQTLLIRNAQNQVVYIKTINYPNGNMETGSSTLRTWVFWDTRHNTGSMSGKIADKGMYTITAENGVLSLLEHGRRTDGHQITALPLVIHLKKDKCANDPGTRFPEAGLLGSKKHGVKWKEGKARARERKLPQGHFLSVGAVMDAVNLAKDVCPGSNDILPFVGKDATVYMPPDGDEVPATKVFIKVYPNGKVHGYPMP